MVNNNLLLHCLNIVVLISMFDKCKRHIAILLLHCDNYFIVAISYSVSLWPGYRLTKIKTKMRAILTHTQLRSIKLASGYHNCVLCEARVRSFFVVVLIRLNVACVCLFDLFFFFFFFCSRLFLVYFFFVFLFLHLFRKHFRAWFACFALTTHANECRCA